MELGRGDVVVSLVLDVDIAGVFVAHSSALRGQGVVLCDSSPK